MLDREVNQEVNQEVNRELNREVHQAETGPCRPAGMRGVRRGSLLVLKIAVTCAFLIGFPASFKLFAQPTKPTSPAQDKKITLSPDALTPDQLDIYRAVLAAWMDNNKGTHTVHLAIKTTPFELSDMDADCGKSLHMTEGSVHEIHQFHAEDVVKLAPSKVELVDPEAQSKEVAKNDPHANIRKGKSIEEVVETGFAHGLTQLGEIHFDHEHTHAIVAYDFSCGRTCGNGSTVILEKKNGAWRILSHCSVSVA
jgi:hypothetical protein